MKYLMLCMAILASGCSLRIPDSFNEATGFSLVYHKTKEKPYRVYEFNLKDYSKLKNQIDYIIKTNQTGWSYYYMGMLGESVPYIVVYVYDGSQQVAAMSIESDGVLILRDYGKNILARHKKDEAQVTKLIELLEGIIKSEGRSGL